MLRYQFLREQGRTHEWTLGDIYAPVYFSQDFALMESPQSETV